MAPVSQRRNVSAKPRPDYGPSYFSCYECGARFPNLQALGGHKSVHSPKRRAEKNSSPQPPTSKKLKLASLEASGLPPLSTSSPMPPNAAVMCPPWAAFVSAPSLPQSQLSTPMLAPLALSQAHQARAFHIGQGSFLPSPAALPQQYSLPQFSADLQGPSQMPWHTQGVTFGTLNTTPAPQLLNAQPPARSLAHQLSCDLSVISGETLAAMQQSESNRTAQALLAEATPMFLGAHDSPAFAKLFFEEAAMKLRHIGRRSGSQPVPSLLRASSDLSSEASALSRSSTGLPGFDSYAGYAFSSKSVSPAISRFVASPTTAGAAATHCNGISRELELSGASLTLVKQTAGEDRTCGSNQSEMGNAILESDRATACFELHPGSAWKPWAAEGNRKEAEIKWVPTEDLSGHEIDLTLKL